MAKSTNVTMTEAIIQAIRKLESRYGCLDPADVLAAARDPASPLHGCFEWDDSAAAAAWRLEQSRQLIRRIRFEVIVEHEERIAIVRYVSDPDVKMPMYIAIPKVRSGSRANRILLAEAARLHGIAARSYGIAVSQSANADAGIVEQFRVICDATAKLKDELGV